MTDNQTAQADTGALNPNDAGALLANLLSDPQEVEQETQATEAPAVEAEAVETPAEAEQPEMVEVDIDGYKVELPKEKAEKLNAERLMQADYTKKTMAAADARKAAEAEAQKASAERQSYAQNLARMEAQIEGALQEQGKAVNWQELLNNDPVEYLRQQHLAQTRQAKLQEVRQAQAQVAAQIQADRQSALERHLVEQQETLLAKLPEWKDTQKATAEKVAIRDYLITQGFDANDLSNVTDARSVVLARKAMLYDQMVSKAQAAAKKVATLPQKVERPGGGESQQLDRRASAFQRLSKSGRVEDAASVIAGLL